ncbi:hypothetical protein KHP62_21090 [Rhodobacteraceae bacterium NNCM2]|nr:hypothetical protein [Coraliihabitans acroporae]
MNTLTISKSVLIACGLAVAVSACAPQKRPQQRRQGPDFAQMAATLGVPESDLMTCLGPRPEPGQRPARPDSDAVTACLVDAGYDVTVDDTEAALSAGAPRRN